SAEAVLSHGFQKGSGRVGRSTTLTDDEKITKAVIAHIRHTETPYDNLLRQATDHCPKETRREDARASVRAQVDDVLRRWRSESTRTPQGPDAAKATSYAPINSCLAETSINLVTGSTYQSTNRSVIRGSSAHHSGCNSLESSLHAPKLVKKHDLLTGKPQAKDGVIEKALASNSLNASIHAHKNTIAESAKGQEAIVAEQRAHRKNNIRNAKKKLARRRRRELEGQSDLASEEQKQLENMIDSARQNSRKMWDNPFFVNTLSADDKWAVSQFRNKRSVKSIRNIFRRSLHTKTTLSTSIDLSAIGEPSTMDKNRLVCNKVDSENAGHELSEKKDDSDDDCVMLYECPVLKPIKPMTRMEFITDLHLSRHAPAIPNPPRSSFPQVFRDSPLNSTQQNQPSSLEDRHPPSPNQAIREALKLMHIEDEGAEPLRSEDEGTHLAISRLKDRSGSLSADLSHHSQDGHVGPEIWMEID
ncbi:MAG: hypothetical protein Q9187_008386, partial [Circinaria calcarea]